MDAAHALPSVCSTAATSEPLSTASCEHSPPYMFLKPASPWLNTTTGSCTGGSAGGAPHAALSIRTSSRSGVSAATSAPAAARANREPSSTLVAYCTMPCRYVDDGSHSCASSNQHHPHGGDLSGVWLKGPLW